VNVVLMARMVLTEKLDRKEKTVLMVVTARMAKTVTMETQVFLSLGQR
jgi:hypothetical protein